MTDPRIKRPCPFCDEAVHLTISEGACPFPIVVDGATVMRADGLEEYEELDGVCCQVCQTLAPLISWNREIPAEALAVLRDFDLPEQEAA